MTNRLEVDSPELYRAVTSCPDPCARARELAIRIVAADKNLLRLFGLIDGERRVDLVANAQQLEEALDDQAFDADDAGNQERYHELFRSARAAAAVRIAADCSSADDAAESAYEAIHAGLDQTLIHEIFTDPSRGDAPGE